MANPVSTIPWDAGNRLKLQSAKGGDPSEWPSEIRVREYPFGEPQAA